MTLQTSTSGRVVTLVAVSQGTVKYLNPGATTWSLATNGTTALATTGPIFSAANQGILYFADGTNWKLFNPSTTTVSAWAASAGALPVDGSSNKPRLIETWRGRTCLSGLLLDPQNWFFSAVDAPTNFDYAPTYPSPTQAVAGNNSNAGMIGEPVFSMVPYTDDVMVFGCNNSIWLMRGDPGAGGQIDRVSDGIGFAWGRPYCTSPDGTIYFFSNRTGIFTLIPGQAPQRISQAIEQTVSQIDTGANAIRALWDDRFQGAHFFVTPLAAAAVTTHFFYEKRTGAWWTDTFTNTSMNPICCCMFDGNTPDDRVALIGSWDGYVRKVNPTAPDDDGTAISSSVVIGPLQSPYQYDMLLKRLQAVLSSTSGTVTYGVYVGQTAEIALGSTAVVTGSWTSARNLSNEIRRAGYAVYVKLTATTPWAFESLRATIEGHVGASKVRGRGR